jgi:hypothetical protein
MSVYPVVYAKTSKGLEISTVETQNYPGQHLGKFKNQDMQLQECHVSMLKLITHSPKNSRIHHCTVGCFPCFSQSHDEIQFVAPSLAWIFALKSPNFSDIKPPWLVIPGL